MRAEGVFSAAEMWADNGIKKGEADARTKRVQPRLLPEIIMPEHGLRWSLAIPNLRLMMGGRRALSMRLRGSLLTPEKTTRTAPRDSLEATVWL